MTQTLARVRAHLSAHFLKAGLDTEPDAASVTFLGAEPIEVLRHPALPTVCRELAAIAEKHFRDAGETMQQCRPRAMRPAAVMAAVYRATLRALLRGQWGDPAAPVSLSRGLKLWLALRHGLL